MRILAGNSDFKSVREQGYYYVDKSMLAADILNAPAQVMLITRPRRFGKTLNLSMLEAFFQYEGDNRALFQGLAIEDDKQAMANQGAYPTIFLTFKDFNSPKWEDCEDKIRALFSYLFLKYKPWIDRAKPQYAELDDVEHILNQSGPLTLYQRSLKLLTALLQRATGSPVILLIDEYDTPINAGQLHGFFDPIVDFMRNLLGAALKDNTSLKNGVLTGILRVAKESIFSGLNNIKSFSLLSETFANRFGFTSTEMEQVLTDFDLIDRKDKATSWYNGYNIGGQLIYNPWSIISLVSSGGRLESHWVNTSSNDLIKQLLLWDKILASGDLAQLLQGKSIQRKISESITLREIQPDDVWSLLFYSGYLTTVDLSDASKGVYELRIPNLEVRHFFEDTVTRWLGPAQHWDVILDALQREDMAAFERHLADYVLKVISYHDLSGPTGSKRRTGTSEALYHMMFLGMLISKQGHYEISSNRESGEGRYDLVLLPKQHQDAGYIFEFKQTTPAGLKAAAERALEQIRDPHYDASLFLPSGMQRIIQVGIAFSGKRLAMTHNIQKLTPGDHRSHANLAGPTPSQISLEPLEKDDHRKLVQAKVAEVLSSSRMKPLLALLSLEFIGIKDEDCTPNLLSRRLLDQSVTQAIILLARALVKADPLEAKSAWEKAQNLIGWLVLESIANPPPLPSENLFRLPVLTAMGAEIALAHIDRRAAKFVGPPLKGTLEIEPLEVGPRADDLLKSIAEQISIRLGQNASWSSRKDRSHSDFGWINGALNFQNSIGESLYLVIDHENAIPADHLALLRRYLPELKVVILQDALVPGQMLIPQEPELAGALSAFLNLGSRWGANDPSPES